MKTFLTLLNREVKSFLYSPIAYVVLFYFLLLAGYNFNFQINVLNGYTTEITVVEAFFSPALFWFPFILCFPLITMRVYSEEFRMGTFETLTTAPVGDGQVVASKFFGVLVFYIILWTPTLLSFAVFQYVTGQTAANASGAYLGAYLLLLLMGCFYISIGCLASALTKDQINAATISFSTITVLLFLAFVPDVLGITSPAIKDIFAYVSATQHMQDFAKGLIDTRPIVWYVSTSLLILIETFQVFQARKWNEGNVVYSLILRVLAVVVIFGSFAFYQRFHLDPKFDLPAILGSIAIGAAFLVICYRGLLQLKGRHLQVGLNVVVQLSVLWVIVVMVNYMSFRHFKRWDFSRDRKYALSSQTKNVLKNLKKPVRAVIFFSSATEIGPDVAALLREYEFASDKKFKAEIVDGSRNLSRAQELQTKYKFGERENIVILDTGGKSKFVNAGEMADWEMPDQISIAQGQSQPRVKAFKGEQVITSALLELLDTKPSKVYYVSGHGEPGLDAPELKLFNEALKRQNIQIAPLTLINATGVPEDCRTLIINGAKRDFSEFDLKLLDDFWNKNGRIFVLLNPYAETPRLASFLQFQGIVPQHDRVIRVGNFLKYDDQQKPQLVTGVVSDPTFVVMDSGMKLTKDLAGLTKKLLGPTQSLQTDTAQKMTAKTRIIPLLQSGEGFWGETDFADTDKQVFFDPQKDHMGPLTLAAAVEKGAVADTRMKMDSSRLIVVGNSELLTPGAARNTEGISLDFTVNSLNWLLDREELIGIAPKEKKNRPLSLTESQLGNIALILMGAIPGFIAVIGLLNWWQRRS